MPHQDQKGHKQGQGRKPRRPARGSRTPQTGSQGPQAKSRKGPPAKQQAKKLQSPGQQTGSQTHAPGQHSQRSEGQSSPPPEQAKQSARSRQSRGKLGQSLENQESSSQGSGRKQSQLNSRRAHRQAQLETGQLPPEQSQPGVRKRGQASCKGEPEVPKRCRAGSRKAKAKAGKAKRKGWRGKGQLGQSRSQKKKAKKAQRKSKVRRQREKLARQARQDPSCWYLGDLRRALQWLLAAISWQGIKFREDCSWTPQSLVVGLLLWAWSGESTLGERFRECRKLVQALFPEQVPLAGSYQAFLKMAGRWTKALQTHLITEFRRKMQNGEGLIKVWRVVGWAVFAVDGTRIDLPRSNGNEECYAPQPKPAGKQQKKHKQGQARDSKQEQARQRKAEIPQMWLSALWHVGWGLPWDFRLGHSGSSERNHLQEMLGELPKEKCLVVGDAGFVGYELWSAVLQAGHQFVIRVGGNVELLRELGYVEERADTVYLWPHHSASKKRPPLVLRLVTVPLAEGAIYLATSVLAEEQLSSQAVAEVYRLRWGVEVFYRHCKQTFERAKLRSRNPRHAEIEMIWSLLGIWAIGLHSHCYLVPRGVAPAKISFVNVLRAYRTTMRCYREVPEKGQGLLELLAKALIDNYQRKHKASRQYPRKKRKHPPKPPRIMNATPAQILLAQSLTDQKQKG